MAKTLQLNFGTSGGKKMMLTVDEPREDLTAEEVSTAMQEVINAASSNWKAIHLMLQLAHASLNAQSPN